MSIKRWVLLGLALVMVLSSLAGCTTQLKVPASTPQVNEPLQSPGEGEGFVDSLWELNDFWEGNVQLHDLVGPEGDALIEEALDVIYGTPEILEVIETEIIEMDLAGAEAILADTPDGVVAIVSIPAIPETEDSKANIIVAIPEDGTEPIVMGWITNIAMIDKYGRVAVYDAFLIRAWWWIDGRIVWWHYWWYDSHNHPNWYYSWWYWNYRYYEYYDYRWYGWYTWFYSWFYWHDWYYWSTWWAF
jgi:hypothetical protein